MSGHVINNTTGGDLQMNIEERLSCLDAFPDVASLDGFVGEVRDYLARHADILPRIP